MFFFLANCNTLWNSPSFFEDKLRRPGEYCRHPRTTLGRRTTKRSEQNSFSRLARCWRLDWVLFVRQATWSEDDMLVTKKVVQWCAPSAVHVHPRYDFRTTSSWGRMKKVGNVELSCTSRTQSCFVHNDRETNTGAAPPPPPEFLHLRWLLKN